MSAGPSRDRAPSRGPRRGPARPRAAARAAGDRHRARVEGAAAPVGPQLPPDVLVPRELPGGPHPRVHRPLLAARRRRPRPVLRARHDAPPGLRRGPDRRRQRPQPVRPPPDRGQGRAGDAGRGPDPAGPAPPRLARRRAALAGARRRVVADPATTVRPGGRLRGPDAAAPRRSRGGRRSRSTRDPRASCCSCGRRSDLDDRTDRFLAAAITGILHGKSASYLSELMPNTFSMAPRYVRDFAARTAFASPERDVFDGLRAKLDRLYRQPPPPTRASRSSATPATSRRAPRAALRERGRPDRARLVVTSPPYLRVVKYGYYNWLRTWFLGFDARAIDATLDDAHHREPYLAFLRDVLAGLRPVADRRRRRRARHRRRRDRPRTPRSRAASGSPSGSGRRPPSPRAIDSRASPLDDVAAVRKMTKLWGDEAGRATKTDRILVLGATEAGRRRALAGAAARRRLGLAARGARAPSDPVGPALALRFRRRDTESLPLLRAPLDRSVARLAPLIVLAARLARPAVAAADIRRLQGARHGPRRRRSTAGETTSRRPSTRPCDAHGVQVWVLFVTRPMTARPPTTRRDGAEQNSLGGDDALLLVAIDDRTDAIWVSDGLADHRRRARRDHHRHAGAGAARRRLRAARSIATVEALGAAGATSAETPTCRRPRPRSRRSPPGGGTSRSRDGGGGIGLGTIAAVVLLGGGGSPALAASAVDRARRGRRPQAAVARPRTRPDAAALARQANALLIATDERIRDAGQETDFAEAQYGAGRGRRRSGRPSPRPRTSSRRRSRSASGSTTTMPEDEPTRDRDAPGDHRRERPRRQGRLDAETDRIRELRDLERDAPNTLRRAPGPDRGRRGSAADGRGRRWTGLAGVRRVGLGARARQPRGGAQGSRRSARRRDRRAAPPPRRGRPARGRGRDPDGARGRDRRARRCSTRSTSWPPPIARCASGGSLASSTAAEHGPRRRDVGARRPRRGRARQPTHAQPTRPRRRSPRARRPRPRRRPTRSRRSAWPPRPTGSPTRRSLAAHDAAAAADRSIAAAVDVVGPDRARRGRPRRGLHRGPPAWRRRGRPDAPRRGAAPPRRRRRRSLATDPRTPSRRRRRAQALAQEAYRLAQDDFSDWDQGGPGWGQRARDAGATRRRRSWAASSAASSAACCPGAAGGGGWGGSPWGGGGGGGARRWLGGGASAAAGAAAAASAPAASAAAAVAAAAAAAADGEPTASALCADGRADRTVSSQRIEGGHAMAQTSILGRISQLVRANINAILDSAEDPEKMLDQLVRDFTNNIAEAEEAIAQTIGNLRMVEDDAREARAASAEWLDKAKAASRRADELRAARATPPRPTGSTSWPRSPSAARSSYETQAKTLETQVAAQTELADKLKDGLNKLRVKREELVQKRDELVSRAKMAQAQSQVQESLQERQRHGPDVARSPATRSGSAARRRWSVVARRSPSSSIDEQFAVARRTTTEDERRRVDGAPGRARRAGEADADAADVPPVGPGRDGPAGPDEEPRPRADDQPAAVVHPPAAGPPLHARGEPAARADRPLRRGGAPDRGRDGEAPHPRLSAERRSRIERSPRRAGPAGRQR